MNAIQIINRDGLRVSTEVIAQACQIDHRSMFALLKAHQERMEKHFGFLRFEIAKTTSDEKGRGRPATFALLTEDQATFLITLTKNTEPVLEFKAALVVAFRQARDFLKGLESPEEALPAPPPPPALPEPDDTEYRSGEQYMDARGFSEADVSHFCRTMKKWANDRSYVFRAVLVPGGGEQRAFPLASLDRCYRVWRHAREGEWQKKRNRQGSSFLQALHRSRRKPR